MKRFFLIPMLLALLLLSGCGCEHQWSEATCTEAPVCTLCGEPQEGGQPEGHNWMKADCKYPKVCTVCKLTEGGLAEHTWKEASCAAPKTCSFCGLTEGEKTGDHVWQEATCTAAKRCKVCKTTEGEALGHDWQGDCDTRRTCSICKKKESKALGHQYENFLCTVCGRKQVETLEDLRLYLNKNYSLLETAVAPVEDLTYKIEDHAGDMFATCDFEIRIWTQLYSSAKKSSIGYIVNYGNMLPYEDRVQAVVDVLDFEMEIAKFTETLFPGKKFMISYYMSGYEYAHIQVGYNSTCYLPFRNYKENNSGINGYGSTDLCDWYMYEGYGDPWLHSNLPTDQSDKLYDDILAACDYDLTFWWYTPTINEMIKDLPFLH